MPLMQYPAVGSPYTNVFTIIKIIAINATKQNINPTIDENINGVVEMPLSLLMHI